MQILPQTLSEAQDLLKSLRMYDDMKKKLWKRGTLLFHQKLNGTHLYRVEYHSSLWEDEAFRQALWLYTKIFSHTPTKNDIVMSENNLLWGGMKIYFDDALLDMSFKRVERKFQK